MTRFANIFLDGLFDELQGWLVRRGGGMRFIDGARRSRSESTYRVLKFIGSAASFGTSGVSMKYVRITEGVGHSVRQCTGEDRCKNAGTL
jgi:hypothetical protein